MTAPTTILFLIPSLVAAGAERQLCELVLHTDPARFQIHVVAFYDSGNLPGPNYVDQLRGLSHVSLHVLGKARGTRGYAGALFRLLRLARRVRPQIIHGYLDGNLPALAVGKLLGIPVVWGIRSVAGNPGKNTPKAHALQRFTARCSFAADLIIYNSEAGRTSFRSIGMRPRREQVIPNGFDTTTFRPDPEAGLARRRAWGIPDGVPLVGIIGRLDRVKDHPTFLRMARRVLATHPEVRFVSVGVGGADYTRRLQEESEAMGLGERLLWAGPSLEMPAVYNALDILVLSSTHEGFPNVVGEAMACGVPPVVTRAGDAAVLVGDPARVAEPGDDEALARILSGLLEAPLEARQALSRASVARIRDVFSVEALVDRTMTCLLGLVE